MKLRERIARIFDPEVYKELADTKKEIGNLEKKYMDISENYGDLLRRYDELEIKLELFEKENNPNIFNYQMLDRLRTDCDYYLGNGNRHVKHLWAGSEKEQIEAMKKLWNSLDDKPEWLSWEKIEEYESKMVDSCNYEELLGCSENNYNDNEEDEESEEKGM